MIGLSLAFQIHAYSVVKEYDDREIATGGRGVAGFLFNHLRTAVEAGFQVHLAKNGFYQTGDEFEQLDSGVIGLASVMERELEDIVEEASNDLARSDDDYRKSDVHERHDIELAWKPSEMPNPPEDFDHAKTVVADAVNGKGRWIDAFRDQTPNPGTDSFDKCHAWRDFSKDQCKDAFNNTVDDVFVPAEMNGGVYVADINHTAFRHERPRKKKRKRAEYEDDDDNDDDDDLDCDRNMPAICQYLLERDTSSSLGVAKGSAPKWKIWLNSYKRFWRKYGFILMRLMCPDKKVRVIVLVCPWCRIMFNKKGVPMGFRQATKSLRSACSSTFVEKFLDLVCTERTEVDRSLTRPISRSPLFLYSSIQLHSTQLMHCVVRNMNLIMKSFLSGKNHLGFTFHGMALKEGRDLVTGQTARRAAFLLGDQERDDSVEDIEDSDDEDSDVDEDATASALSSEEKKAKRVSERNFRRKVIGLLKNNRPGDFESWENSIRLALDYIGRKEDGTPQTPGDRSARFAILMKSGMLIKGSPTEQRLRKEYDGKLNNLGNRTSCRHSANASTIGNTTKSIRYYIEKRKPFFIQAGGSALPGKMKRADKDGGALFDPVAIDGREIIYHEYGTYSMKGKIVKTHRGNYFDISEFVPGLTWLGLLERLYKEVNGPGTTKRSKAETLKDYYIVVDNTVCKAPKSRAIEHPNNLYVVRVTIVKKGTVKAEKNSRAL